MTNIIEIIKGLHGIQHDVLRIVTAGKAVHEIIPRYDPVIREKIRVLKTQISDKAVLILVDYIEHVIDAGTKTGFCDMSNLIESMIDVYLESDVPVDTPVEIKEPGMDSSTVQKYRREQQLGYRIMNKKHKIRTYSGGSIYDVILQHLIKNLPTDFMKTDVETSLKDYYKKSKLRRIKDSSLDTYAGIYLRCGQEITPPVFKITGQTGGGRGRKKTIYRKTGEKLQIEDLEFTEIPISRRWSDYEDKIIIANYKDMPYRAIQQKFLPYRTVAAVEKHAGSVLHLRKPYALLIEDEPVKNKPDEKTNDPMVDIADEKEEPSGDDSCKKPEIKETIDIEPDEPIKTTPKEEPISPHRIKETKTDDNIVNHQSSLLHNQIYIFAEESGWTRSHLDINLRLIKKHFSDKTIDEIKAAIGVLIGKNRVSQRGSERVRFK